MREQKSTFILPDFRLCCNKSAHLSSVARNRVLDCPENKARLLGATVSQRFVGARFPRPRLYLLAFVALLCKRAEKFRPDNLFRSRSRTRGRPACISQCREDVVLKLARLVAVAREIRQDRDG